MLKKCSLFRLALCCSIPVQLFLPCLPFPVPPAASQASLGVPSLCAISKWLLKMALTNLPTSTVLVAMTTHKNNHFRGDYCPGLSCSNSPWLSTHSTWWVTGGSSFLRLPARLVPYFWLIISKSVRCKALPVPLHLLTCQLSDSLSAFCFSAPVRGILFWPPKTHPQRASCPGAERGAALFHSFTHDEESCQVHCPFEAAIWVCFVLSLHCIFRWTFPGMV